MNGFCKQLLTRARFTENKDRISRTGRNLFRRLDRLLKHIGFADKVAETELLTPFILKRSATGTLM